MLHSVTINSGDSGDRNKPFTPDPDPDPDPGGQPLISPTVVELPFTRRHHADSVADEPHLRAA